MELNLQISILLFVLAAVAIVFSAVFLTTAADIIATRMNLGRLWVGSLLLAGATSLPELATAVAAAPAAVAAPRQEGLARAPLRVASSRSNDCCPS